MVNVETFAFQGQPPVGFFQPWAGVADLGSGLARGLGRPTAQWFWGFILPAMKAQLRTYCPDKSARVFIKTLIDNATGTYATYEAAMLWPDDESQIGSPPFQIDFRDLILQP